MGHADGVASLGEQSEGGLSFIRPDVVGGDDIGRGDDVLAAQQIEHSECEGRATTAGRLDRPKDFGPTLGGRGRASAACVANAAGGRVFVSIGERFRTP
jgi:hypothetical protein